MASTLSLVLLVFFFCQPTVWGRMRLLELTAASGAGICKLMVETWGYVTTKDGYVLSLQRIPKGLSDNAPDQGKPPVLLQHGISMDGVTWLLNAPNQSLAFMLADSGYDVWIANSRGYWDWSWDELVAYDLPAIVLYVYHQSGQMLHYVGHSQLVDKVKSAGLLSPVAYLSRISPLARAAVDNFLSETSCNKPIEGYMQEARHRMHLLVDIVHWVITLGLGKTTSHDSTTDTHMGQSLARDGTIAMYDYEDRDKNTQHYGHHAPPEHNLTNIPNDLPLFFAHGGRDALSDVDDVKFLLDSLKTHDTTKLFLQFIEDYAHADYIMALNAKQLVYDPLISFSRLHA
ncbi:hypothetical protein Cgig2_022316 [Carnegiea gigantea]|uniref:Partial AB-hydrolase lipase domain-containing protein n=1 Tax=Carnegiea gigantea TaxID=171969 RepID=A0A9Q1GUD6_9CARY|nr:hypothetical protein Cgig2_022316 [Carnegiea gigantea]